ncbi:MAG: ABC transporter substrate-binding protein [bacterium]
MTKNLKIGLIVLALIVVVGLVVGLGNSKPKNDVKEIVIGSALSLSGAASIDGNNMKDGLEFAKTKLAERGINVKIVYEDDQTIPVRTVSAVKKLIDVDKPVAIIGPTWSFLADSAAKTITDAKVVAYLPGNTSEIETQRSEYYFNGAPMTAAKDTYTTKWIKDLKLQNVAIVVEDSVWGDKHIEAFTKGVEASGAKLAYVEKIAYGADSAALQAIVTHLKTSGVDAVLYTGFDKSTAVVLNKMRELQVNIPILCATEIPVGLAEQKIITTKSGDGVYVIIPTKSDAFENDYKAVYGKYPGSYADRAADGLFMIVKALEEKPANMTLRDYMASDDFSYKGYAGEYKFDKNGDITKSEWRIEKLADMVK